MYFTWLQLPHVALCMLNNLLLFHRIFLSCSAVFIMITSNETALSNQQITSQFPHWVRTLPATTFSEELYRVPTAQEIITAFKQVPLTFVLLWKSLLWVLLYHLLKTVLQKTPKPLIFLQVVLRQTPFWVSHQWLLKRPCQLPTDQERAWVGQTVCPVGTRIHGFS